MTGLRRVKIHAAGFMLDQYACLGNPCVEEFCRAFHRHGDLKLNAALDVLDAEDVEQK